MYLQGQMRMGSRARLYTSATTHRPGLEGVAGRGGA